MFSANVIKSKLAYVLWDTLPLELPLLPRQVEAVLMMPRSRYRQDMAR